MRVRDHFERGGRSSGGSAAQARQEQENKPKIDLSNISKPGDVMKAIMARKQEAERGRSVSAKASAADCRSEAGWWGFNCSDGCYRGASGGIGYDGCGTASGACVHASGASSTATDCAATAAGRLRLLRRLRRQLRLFRRGRHRGPVIARPTASQVANTPCGASGSLQLLRPAAPVVVKPPVSNATIAPAAATIAPPVVVAPPAPKPVVAEPVAVAPAPVEAAPVIAPAAPAPVETAAAVAEPMPAAAAPVESAPCSG